MDLDFFNGFGLKPTR